MLFNIQMRQLFWVWIILSVAVQYSLEAQSNAKPKPKSKSKSPAKPENPAPGKLVKKNPGTEPPKKNPGTPPPKKNPGTPPPMKNPGTPPPMKNPGTPPPKKNPGTPPPKKNPGTPPPKKNPGTAPPKKNPGTPPPKKNPGTPPPKKNPGTPPPKKNPGTPPPKKNPVTEPPKMNPGTPPPMKNPGTPPPKNPAAMTQPHANFLLLALNWLKNNVVISDETMKNSWTAFTNILKSDKLMQNPDWQQQLIFLISQNGHLTDFIHNLNKMLHIYPWLFNGLAMNIPDFRVEHFKHWLRMSTSQLPYLGYRPGHGVQHPYHPGIYSQMYQMPHNYRMSPQAFHQSTHQLNPGMTSNNLYNINGCPVVNVTFNLQINSKSHCWTSVSAPQQSLKNFFILAAYQNKCFKFEMRHRNSRLPPASVTGPIGQSEYIRSINGIEETSTMMWSVDELNGSKDLELSSFLPRHNTIIIINYADSNLTKDKSYQR